jgi:mRNA interferase MazF
MSPKRGDLALVYYPHSDLTTIKLRPVLVVQADGLNTGIPQVIVAMVSSNFARAGHPSRMTIRLAQPGATRNGLKCDSVIMTDNLATIELRLLKRVIGRMAEMKALDESLRRTLGL